MTGQLGPRPPLAPQRPQATVHPRGDRLASLRGPQQSLHVQGLNLPPSWGQGLLSPRERGGCLALRDAPNRMRCCPQGVPEFQLFRQDPGTG